MRWILFKSSLVTCDAMDREWGIAVDHRRETILFCRSRCLQHNNRRLGGQKLSCASRTIENNDRGQPVRLIAIWMNSGARSSLSAVDCGQASDARSSGSHIATPAQAVRSVRARAVFGPGVGHSARAVRGRAGRAQDQPPRSFLDRA